MRRPAGGRHSACLPPARRAPARAPPGMPAGLPLPGLPMHLPLVPGAPMPRLTRGLQSLSNPPLLFSLYLPTHRTSATPPTIPARTRVSRRRTRVDVHCISGHGRGSIWLGLAGASSEQAADPSKGTSWALQCAEPERTMRCMAWHGMAWEGTAHGWSGEGAAYPEQGRGATPRHVLGRRPPQPSWWLPLRRPSADVAFQYGRGGRCGLGFAAGACGCFL